MNKKLITSVVAGSMLALSSLNIVHAEEQYQTVAIKIDGDLKNFSQSPLIYNDVTLVPLRGVFETLGIDVKWNDKERKVIAQKGTDVLELKIGEKQAIKNYQPIPLMMEAKIINERTMVPLRFVSESFGAIVNWDQTTRTVNITSPVEGEPSTENPSDNKAETGLPVITFAESYEKAINNSPEIRTQLLTIKQEEERRDDTSTLVFNNVLNKVGYLNVAYAKLGMAEKQLVIKTDAIYLQVKSAYNAILQAEEKVKLLEKQLELAKVQKNISEQKAQQGIISAMDMTLANNALIEKEKELKAAQDALAKAYDAFNHLVGYPLDQRYNLTDVPKYEGEFDTDVNYQVNKILSDSIWIKLYEENVKIAESALDTYVFNSPSNGDSYTVTEINIDKAQSTLSEQKKTLEKSIRDTYHTIQDLQNKYEILKTQLTDVEENQKAMKVRYDQGMIPLVNLMEINIQADTIKQNMFDIAANLEILKTQYEKPWLAAGSGN